MHKNKNGLLTHFEIVLSPDKFAYKAKDLIRFQILPKFSTKVNITLISIHVQIKKINTDEFDFVHFPLAVTEKRLI